MNTNYFKLSTTTIITILLFVCSHLSGQVLTLTGNTVINDVSELSSYNEVDLNGYHLDLNFSGELLKDFKINSSVQGDTTNQKVTIGENVIANKLSIADANPGFNLFLNVLGEAKVPSIKFKTEFSSYLKLYVGENATLHNTGIAEVFYSTLYIDGTFKNDGNLTSLSANSIDITIGETGKLEVLSNVFIGQYSNINIFGEFYVEEDLRVYAYTIIDFGEDCDVGKLTVIQSIILDVHNDIDVFKVEGCGTVNQSSCQEFGTGGTVNEGRFCGDLPVELVYFKGFQENNDHILIWRTATEQNASHFEIQGSYDRNNWTTLGSVQANGNTNFAIDYEFVQRGEKFAFYRLVQYDYNGEYSIFGSISIGNTNEFTSRVFPNLAHANAQFKLEMSGINSELPLSLNLFDHKGNLVWNTELPVSLGDNNLVSSFQIDRPLTSGLYLLVATNGSKKEVNKIVIK
ncbi:hypothetical protein KMW28_21745 [Flammeovirga yaeyamensis]|uniref:Secretion system C-terminal sorting domain-containing protein n=1 Tax=Flammeovirga yaeyamensis TaxID=367791 RepID=A0AAX1NC59_9BACT|nr:hypothetical protein [Flammeovirga yaeyamensis]MBB3697021.1 hypothetical protein [Flammeovirga yaeyamensis]NMF33684.1 hypothetical protein [Flammeovirga yaeyamensis]QWG05050.1 hypothetical protein KMW28_21745 [Flammeovirga yaeyamensis]